MCSCITTSHPDSSLTVFIITDSAAHIKSYTSFNAAQSHGTDIINPTTEFVQHAVDNVEHNIRTLDGHDIVHGMGMIAAVTAGTRLNRPIFRVHVTSLYVAIVRGVQIHGRTTRGGGNDLPCLPNHHLRSAPLVEGSHDHPLRAFSE